MGSDVSPEQTGLTFLASLRQRCQVKPGRIGFPDSDDIRILRVADRLLTEGSVSEVTLFSTKAATLGLGQQYAIDLERHGRALRFEERASQPERLAEAASQLGSGRLDAVLAGNIATTAEVIRAGISGVGLAPGVRTVSGGFFMNRVANTAGEGAALYYFADCAVVIAPTVRQLVDIAVESVKTWRLLVPDQEPIAAFLSFSTKGSAHHESQAKIAEATAHFKAQNPNVICDGEMQFDAAIDAEIGRKKAPNSLAAGRANCCIFPDLNAGNIAYKVAQRLGGFEAYGPILQGLAKPFSDLSRGATDGDILASAYINLLKRQSDASP